MAAPLHAALALLVAILVAGCAENAPAVKSTAPSTAPAPTLGEDTGSIAGRVIDDELRPLTAAEVAVIGPVTASATTDSDGRFTLNDLAPGSYSVQSARLGYESAGRRVDVTAGEVAEIELVLQAIAVSEARSVLFLADGYIGVEGSVPGLFLRLNPTGDDKRTFFYEVEPDAVSAITAITWQSSAPATAKRLDLQLYVGKSCLNSVCKLLNRTMKPPPAVLQNDQIQETIQGESKYGVLSFFGLAPCWYIENGTNVQSCVQNTDALVQVAYQQRIQVATAIFYLEPAPRAYNPLPK